MIKTENIEFTYWGSNRPAVDDVSFEVEKGEIFGFLGPSGAGKTTTVSILIKLLSGYGGTASVMGRNLVDTDKSYFENIGVCFELPSHYLRLTALENLDFFASLYSLETLSAEKVLRMVGLFDSANKKVSEFSKGMKMRLNFARSLLHHPEVYFLDEPTIGLDPINARLIKDIILEKKSQGKTVFLTTHNMNVADELCDRIGLIDGGRIQVIDSPHNLKLQYGTRRVKVETVSDGKPEVQEFEMDGLGENPTFLSVLKDEILTIHSQEPTLEEVFIKVTGRGLV